VPTESGHHVQPAATWDARSASLPSTAAHILLNGSLLLKQTQLKPSHTPNTYSISNMTNARLLSNTTQTAKQYMCHDIKLLL